MYSSRIRSFGVSCSASKTCIRFALWACRFQADLELICNNSEPVKISPNEAVKCSSEEGKSLGNSVVADSYYGICLREPNSVSSTI